MKITRGLDMSHRTELNSHLASSSITKKPKRQILQDWFTGHAFFKTLFRPDHPFLVYELRDKGVCIKYRIYVKEPYLPGMPPFFGSISILDFDTPGNHLPEALADERFRQTFYDHVQSYIVDVLHYDTEAERDALVLYGPDGVNYDAVSSYLNLITKNFPFMQTGVFHDDEQFCFLMEPKPSSVLTGSSQTPKEARFFYEVKFEPVELTFEKPKVNDIVSQVKKNGGDVNENLKAFFSQTITRNIHRMKAPGTQGINSVPPETAQRLKELIGVGT